MSTARRSPMVNWVFLPDCKTISWNPGAGWSGLSWVSPVSTIRTKLKRNVNNFMIFYRQAPPADQAALRKIWEEAGLGAFPESGDQAAPAKRSLKEKVFGWLGRRRGS